MPRKLFTKQTVDDLKQARDSIQWIASEYARIIGEMQEKRIDSVQALNVANYVVGVARLRSALVGLQEGFANAMMAPSVRDAELDALLEREAPKPTNRPRPNSAQQERKRKTS